LYFAGWLAALTGPAAAQSIPPEEMRALTVPYVPPAMFKVRTQVDLVEVPVVVRDSRQRAVAGLSREDFELHDDGKKQAITTFSVQHFAVRGEGGSGRNEAVRADASAPKEATTRPRFVALLFDNLNTGSTALKPATDAAARFVRTSLAPGDRVAVVTTATAGKTDFLEDVPALLEQIARVTGQQRFSDDGAGECPHIRAYEAYLIVNRLDRGVLQAKVDELRACLGPMSEPESKVTSLSQVIWEHALFNSRNTVWTLESLVSAMSRLPGQRMILLTSAGFYSGNLELEEDQLMAKALHSEVVINTLDVKGLYAVTPGGAAETRQTAPTARAKITNIQTQAREPEAKNDAMASLALGTGGTFYHNSNDLADGFRKLGIVPETVYVLGFAPTEGAADGRYHSLKVRLTLGGRYAVQARLGYMAPAAAAAVQAAPVSRLDRAMTAADTVADLPAGFFWGQREATPGITLVIQLDIKGLHFENVQKRWTKKLTIAAVLTDSHGGFVTGKRTELELNFTEATYARLSGTGTKIAMTLLAPPGSYAARAVVQDAEGKLAAAGETVLVE
jgi:VWFA-related protein